MIGSNNDDSVKITLYLTELGFYIYICHSVTNSYELEF